METIESPTSETREEAIARILREGHLVRTAAELYGPGPGSDDPEDLDEFLASLSAGVRSPRSPDEEEG